jgi:hypothetical protein
VKYREDIAQLGPLETFDATAFQGNAEYTQDLCNFILALSLFYNDFRDLIAAQMLLSEAYPGDNAKPSPEVGQFRGLSLHLFRIQAGFVHELAELVERNLKIIASAGFQKIVKGLNRKGREAWASVVAAAENRPGDDPLARVVFFARNKVGFHYDQKEILRGYAKCFIEPTGRVPFISRGTKMANTRFYFADAAAEAYIRSLGDPEVVEPFYAVESPLLLEINLAVREIIVRFINSRSAFRNP